MKTKKLIPIFLLLVIFSSCKKESNPETNDEEVITTMKLTFVPVGGGTTLTYQYDDADGPGGNAPVQDVIALSPSKSYQVSVQLLNKTVNPVEDITTEVQAESDAHRFYYEPSVGSNITVSQLDNDTNGVPLGVNGTWTSGATSTGTLKVTLRHYPGTPPGKETADPVNSTKSATDVEVVFNTSIQ
jgi:hypothetical protein